MMYSKIIFLKCILLVICYAQEHRTDQNNGKDVTGSYSYNHEFAKDNNREYGHKIEVKIGNSKENLNAIKVKQSNLAPKPFTQEKKLLPKPVGHDYTSVSNQSPQEYVGTYQPSRRPASPKQVTLDKNQLAILLAQNKNPYLLSEKDKQLLSQQAAHIQSFPYQLSDIQLTSQYIPESSSQYGHANVKSNQPSQQQQLVASKPAYKHIFVPEVPTQQQSDLYSKKYSGATAQIKNQQQQFVYSSSPNDGHKSSSTQQQSGLNLKEYSSILSQAQNHETVPQFVYSSPANNGATQHNLLASSPTQHQAGLYPKQQQGVPQFTYSVPSKATQHNPQLSSPIQQQSGTYLKEYSGLTSQVQDQQGVPKFVYSLPTSGNQHNLQLSSQPQLGLNSKEYSGATSQGAQQLVYTFPTNNEVTQHSPQATTQTQQQFSVYPNKQNQQKVHNFGYSNNVANQHIPVPSSTQQQSSLPTNHYSDIFSQASHQQGGQNFAYIYPSNDKVSQHTPVLSSIQQQASLYSKQYSGITSQAPNQQEAHNNVLSYSSNVGASQHSNTYQSQYNPSGHYPQNIASPGTYQFPQYTSQPGSQGYNFVQMPQTQPMQKYVFVSPTSQTALPQAASFPQHLLTQQTHTEQYSQQPQIVLANPSSQTAYNHIPQASYNYPQMQQTPNNAQSYYNGNPSSNSNEYSTSNHIAQSANIGDLKIKAFTDALANYGNAAPLSSEKTYGAVQPEAVGVKYSFPSANNKDLNSAYGSVPNQNYVNTVAKEGTPNIVYNVNSQHKYNVHEPTSETNSNVKYVYYAPSNAPTADGDKSS